MHTLGNIRRPLTSLIAVVVAVGITTGTCAAAWPAAWSGDTDTKQVGLVADRLHHAPGPGPTSGQVLLVAGENLTLVCDVREKIGNGDVFPTALSVVVDFRHNKIACLSG
jgi:hypothetical protein